MRTDDEQQRDLVEQLLHGPLPVRGGVADVLARRPFELREAGAQDVDDLARLVDGERRLGDVGDPSVRPELELFGILHGLDEDRRLRSLAERSLDLLVPGVPDQDDRVAAVGVPPRLRVHLRDERTGGVDRDELPGRRRVAHGRRDSVGREDDGRSFRHVVDRVDEDGAALLELPDDVRVVHDLLAHVHGRPIELQGALDCIDGPLDSRAVAAGRGQEDSRHHTVGQDSSAL